MLRSRLLGLLAGWIVSRRTSHPVRVAIDGVDAAGKTTFADELAPHVAALGRPVIRASVDGFHNPRQMRYAQGSLSPFGFYRDSFNYRELKKYLLDPLGEDGSRIYRSALFDVRAETVASTNERQAPLDAILLFDGIFLCRPELRSAWDSVVLLDVNREVAISRGIARDAPHCGGIEAARVRYQERYCPGQDLYFAESRPKDIADIIIDNTNFMKPKILKGSARLM